MYYKKYLKYKQKYLDLKEQIGGNKFTATVIRNTMQGHHSKMFVIDVHIHGKFPKELKTKHHDKTLNYVAFVAFVHQNEKCDLVWNLEVKDFENDTHYDILEKYKETNQEEIINLAIQEFKMAFPTYQPEKTWK
jgi:hypothetical protein